jgi:hypothetical protein
MFEPGPESVKTRERGSLNTAQRRRLSITCLYIDNLLSEVEHALHSASSQSPFPRYVLDVTPAQIQAIEDHIARLRAQLLRTLEWQHLKPEQPEIPVTRSILTDLAFVDIAIEELKPRYMRGCGAVPDDAVDGLNGVVESLRSLAGSMERYIRGELDTNEQNDVRSQA